MPTQISPQGGIVSAYEPPNAATSLTAAGIPVNQLTATAAQTNLGALPSIEQLTNQINQLNIASQQAANLARIPGEAGLEATSSANIANLLAGNVSPSTINLLGQQAAERGVATGSPAGASTQADYLRALGLTSEQLQAMGQTELSGAVARNPAAKLFDPTTQLLTPAQTGQLNLQQQSLALQAARLAAQGAGGGGAGGAVTTGTTGGAPGFAGGGLSPGTSGLYYPGAGTATGTATGTTPGLTGQYIDPTTGQAIDTPYTNSFGDIWDPTLGWVINPDQTGATGTTGTAGAPLVPASAGGDPFGLDWGLADPNQVTTAGGLDTSGTDLSGLQDILNPEP